MKITDLSTSEKAHDLSIRRRVIDCYEL